MILNRAELESIKKELAAVNERLLELMNTDSAESAEEARAGNIAYNKKTTHIVSKTGKVFVRVGDVFERRATKNGETVTQTLTEDEVFRYLLAGSLSELPTPAITTPKQVHEQQLKFITGLSTSLNKHCQEYIMATHGSTRIPPHLDHLVSSLRHHLHVLYQYALENKATFENQNID